LNRDLVFGGAALALAAGYYLLAARIPESQLSDAVGPQGLPRIYAYLLGGLSLILIVNSVRGPKSRATRPGARVERPQPSAQPRVLRPAGVVAIGAIYIVVVPWLGYIVSLAALIAATTYYQGGGANRRVLFVAVSGALLFWLLFVAILGIQHPAGFWASLL
jgi:putative tricarboxylic transport membrane protein